MTPTPEQQALVHAAANSSSSIMVQAYAGCSKTTSLILAAQALPAVPTLALVFNAKNRKEMEEKFPKHIECKTMNGLGHGAWGRCIGKRLIVDDKKLGNIVSAVFKEVGHKGPKDDWDYVRRLVDLAMQNGLVPSGMAGKGLVPDTYETWSGLAFEVGQVQDDLIGLAQEVLRTSIKLSIAGTISFNDQIYMSALFGGVFPKFPIVMVDEAQDLSPLNHIQLSKVTPPAGRLIVVGDKFQAIYGWRGAASNSMGDIRKLKNDWIDLKLSQTFRCPKIVVARQQTHVPGFTAFHTNREGVFHHIKRPEDIAVGEAFWSWKDLESLREAHGAQSVGMLCRNNSPLFSSAFRLIRQGIGCTMLGRDIGKSLASLVKKIIPSDDVNVTECIELITKWMDHEVAMARANENDLKADAAHDKGHSLLAVIDSAQNVFNRGGLLARLDEVFNASYGLVTLSTIHRAKGLEWDLVVLLDPWRIPSKRSLGDAEALQQEMNLKYVAETRAKLVLVHANAEDLKRS
jgi:hypothetical protein